MEEIHFEVCHSGNLPPIIACSAAAVDDRDVWIQKCCVRIIPRSLTTDPQTGGIWTWGRNRAVKTNWLVSSFLTSLGFFHFFSVFISLLFFVLPFTDPPLSLTTLFTHCLPLRGITDLIMHFLYRLFFLLALLFPPSLFHVIFHRSLQPVTSHALPYRLSPVLTPAPTLHPLSICCSLAHAPSPLPVLFSSPFFSSLAILN